MSMSNERYYSTRDYTSNHASALIDNDITTTPSTNEENINSLQQKNPNPSNMVISAAENSNEKGTNNTDNKSESALDGIVITTVEMVEVHGVQNGDSSSRLNTQQ